jgi:hypothetical protein
LTDILNFLNEYSLTLNKKEVLKWNLRT